MAMESEPSTRAPGIMKELESNENQTVMEIDEAIYIIRKPDERTIKKEIVPPVYIKTKPEIVIEKRDYIEKKISLPPSKCDLTLNERFTLVLCHLQKKEIDPGFQDLQCPNTLIGRLQRCKSARLSAAPYSTPRQSNLSTPILKTGGSGILKSLGQDTRPSPFEMFLEPEPHEPGEPLSSIFAKYMKARPYCTGPSKSRAELDDEIEQYFISVGGRGKRVFQRKTKEMLEKLYYARYGGIDPGLDLDDISDNMGNININSNPIIQSEEEPNLFSSFVKAIKSKSFFKQEKASLDQDLDDYFGSRRKPRSLSQSLDDDLEDYKRQDPRNNQTKKPLTTTTANSEDDEFAEFM